MCLTLTSKRTKTNTTKFNTEKTTVDYNIKGYDALEYISVSLFKENSN